MLSFLQRKPKLFISHSNKDAIDHQKYFMYYQRHISSIITDEHFPKGHLWHYDILNGLLTSDLIICHLTIASLDSRWVLEEIGFGLSMGYIYFVGPQGIVSELKRRSIYDDKKQDSIMPKFSSILRHQIDLYPQTTSFEQFLCNRAIRNRIIKFARTRGLDQKDYREKLLSIIDLDDYEKSFLERIPRDLSFLFQIRAARRRELRQLGWVYGISEPSASSVTLNQIDRMIEDLVVAKLPGSLLEYDEPIALWEQAQQHEARASECVRLAAQKDPTRGLIGEDMDRAVLEMAAKILKCRIAGHLLLRTGRLGDAFNMFGNASTATRSYADVLLRLLDNSELQKNSEEA